MSRIRFPLDDKVDILWKNSLNALIRILFDVHEHLPCSPLSTTTSYTQGQRKLHIYILQKP